MGALYIIGLFMFAGYISSKMYLPLIIVYYSQEDIEMYGIDWDGPLTNDPAETPNIVEIPETPNPLVPNIFQEMCGQIDPLHESSNYGIDIFIQAMSFLETRGGNVFLTMIPIYCQTCLHS